MRKRPLLGRNLEELSSSPKLNETGAVIIKGINRVSLEEAAILVENRRLV